MTLRKFFAAGAASAFLLTALAGTADAQGRGRGQAQADDKDKGKKAAPADKNKDKQVTVVFRDNHRVTFRDYFVKHKITAQPLPPGIAMNIARGKPLAPGIAKRALPNDLVILLPRIGTDVTYYMVGDRVVAVQRGNVIDVLVDIFR